MFIDTLHQVALNRGWTYRRRVRPHEAGRSVVEHLTAEYPHSGAATWLARVEAGEVEVDNDCACAGTVLRDGQWLTWHRPPWDEPDVPLHFDVLHEDEALVAVAKPAGLPTMPAGGFLLHTLLTEVRRSYPDARPVHRLGRHTSGVVLCARSAETAAAIGRVWNTPAVRKCYRALMAGAPEWERCEVTAAIGPVPHARLGTVHAASQSGRPARSTFVVRERRDGTTLCDVTIETGRPHQIRIHAACTGHPLAGDPLYVSGGLPAAHTSALPGDAGYLLHAHRLELPHPSTGRPFEVVAPLPDVLRALPS